MLLFCIVDKRGFGYFGLQVVTEKKTSIFPLSSLCSVLTTVKAFALWRILTQCKRQTLCMLFERNKR